MSNEKRSDRRSRKKAGGSKKKASLPSFEFSENLLKGGASAGGGEDASREGAASREGEPADRNEASPEEPGKKISLPAFGFAEELLASLKKPQEEPSTGQVVRERADEAASTVDRALPEEEAGGEERIFAFTDRLQAEADEAQAAKPMRIETWVSFSLAGETFALPVEPVHEVVRPTAVTRVPHAPFPIRGVTNLRGRVVPVIDLRRRLELSEGEITRSSRIMVVGSRGRRLGLLVDAVHQVVHIDLDRVQPPPDDVMTIQSDYISGVYHLGEELVLLLDVDRVLIIKDPVPVTPASTSGDSLSL